jgi:phenylacetate-CoA ligase
VIDAGVRLGIRWRDFCTRLVFAGEVFSEEWRSLLAERTSDSEIWESSASLYGTADGGVLGNETPISIAIRRFFASNPDAAKKRFGESRLPTLVQYDPLSRYFEVSDGTLVVTGDGGVPLIRYHIADKGGIIGFDEMVAFLGEYGVTSPRDLLPAESVLVHPLPFVYVFGRADFTISYYGANIFPENVAVGLEKKEFARLLTGKFVMSVGEGTSVAGVAQWKLEVELAPGVIADIVDTTGVAQSVANEVRRLNSEFANYVPPGRQCPVVSLRPFEDPVSFPSGVKHRYVRR